MRINTNVEAFNAQRNLSATSLSYAKSVEKLSSGLRINRAGDDAAGLSISEKMRAQVKGLAQAQRNAQDGISMIQTAEGALNEVHSMMQRMRELAVQASNDTLSSTDRVAVKEELAQLKDEVNAISSRTKFNGKALLTGATSTTIDPTSTTNAGAVVVNGTNTSVVSVDVSGAKAGTTFTFADVGTTMTLSDGTTTQAIADAASTIAADGTVVLDFNQLGIKVTLGSIAGETGANVAAGLAGDTIVTAAGSGSANFQIGTAASDALAVNFEKVDISATSELSALNTALSNFDGTQSVANAQALITAVDTAIDEVSEQRSYLGARQNRLEHTIANLGVAQENLSASESRIRDVDMAAEMVNFTKTGILQQAGQAILAQANQAPQGVLSLLR
jgi:flagellin